MVIGVTARRGYGKTRRGQIVQRGQNFSDHPCDHAQLLAEPLVEPLTQLWRVLYLTESPLIYSNSSLKLDSIINFFSYQPRV